MRWGQGATGSIFVPRLQRCHEGQWGENRSTVQKYVQGFITGTQYCAPVTTPTLALEHPRGFCTDDFPPASVAAFSCPVPLCPRRLGHLATRLKIGFSFWFWGFDTRGPGYLLAAERSRDRLEGTRGSPEKREGLACPGQGELISRHNRTVHKRRP